MLAGTLTPAHRQKLAALKADAGELQRERGYLDDALIDSMVALMGEGAAAPRRTRSWAKPEWCVATCPGCARFLRLLVVPTLDVIQCIHCETTSYVCRAPDHAPGLGKVLPASAPDASTNGVGDSYDDAFNANEEEEEEEEPRTCAKPRRPGLHALLSISCAIRRLTCARSCLTTGTCAALAVRQRRVMCAPPSLALPAFHNSRLSPYASPARAADGNSAGEAEAADVAADADEARAHWPRPVVGQMVLGVAGGRRVCRGCVQAAAWCRLMMELTTSSRLMKRAPPPPVLCLPGQAQVTPARYTSGLVISESVLVKL